MKFNRNLWFITMAFQAAIAGICLSQSNWQGMMGGIFGAFMCLIYWDEIGKPKQTESH